jgi:hypothetical protein
MEIERPDCRAVLQGTWPAEDAVVGMVKQIAEGGKTSREA